VTPRLKRSGLDLTDIANFRLVLNLTFMSKVNTAGLVLRMPVTDEVRTVRRATRVGPRSTAVRALHRRAGTDRRDAHAADK